MDQKHNIHYPNAINFRVKCTQPYCYYLLIITKRLLPIDPIEIWTPEEHLKAYNISFIDNKQKYT